jgi:hypothetical protein
LSGPFLMTGERQKETAIVYRWCFRECLECLRDGWGEPVYRAASLLVLDQVACHLPLHEARQISQELRQEIEGNAYCLAF